jgi:hypothetical protein
MNITGIETLVFGVEDMAGCSQYLLDYGLERATDHPHHYVALDGTGVELFAADADHLPPAPNGCQMRKCVMGVADAETLQAIARELERDREVRRLPDGSLQSVDDANGRRARAHRPTVTTRSHRPWRESAPTTTSRRHEWAFQLRAGADAPH